MKGYIDSVAEENVSRQICTVEFWKGHQAEIDLSDIKRSAVLVKGSEYHNPLRFLEIYGNLVSSSDGLSACTNTQANAAHVKSSGIKSAPRRDRQFASWTEVLKNLMPNIPGVRFELAENVRQPPFSWGDCDPRTLGINFTYNTNALYRILSNLHNAGHVPGTKLDALLDRACTILSNIYKCHDHSIIKNLNNNINMYLISKVVELLVGRNVYDAEQQELYLTRKSLQISLEMAREHKTLPTMEKMAVALGKGVTFIEKRLAHSGINKEEHSRIRTTSYQYHEKKLAIDHRQLLLNMVANAGIHKGTFLLVAIFDDATETVDDLLWLQDLLVQFPFFKVHILVNTAQISINFYSQMLTEVLTTSEFTDIAARFGNQFLVSEVYCPFISYQANYLPINAHDVINEADAVYVKGANFFETCQIPQKPVFHAFVVYGPVSRKYTGLNDNDGVFALVPAGKEGYVHHRDPKNVITLRNVVAENSKISSV